MCGVVCGSPSAPALLPSEAHCVGAGWWGEGKLWNRLAASTSVSQGRRWQRKDRDTRMPAKPGVFIWWQQGKGLLKVT